VTGSLSSWWVRWRVSRSMRKETFTFTLPQFAPCTQNHVIHYSCGDGTVVGEHPGTGALSYCTDAVIRDRATKLTKLVK